MRPDFVPPLPAAAPPVIETLTAAPLHAPTDAPLAAEASESTNPAAGSPG
jgi:hypothetical protein